MRQGLGVIATGVGVGIAGALALGNVLTAILYTVKPHDPLVLSVVAALMVAIGLVSCWIPARRAGRVDPAVALRWE